MSASKKESIQVTAYSRRLKDNTKSILDNYAEILKISRIDEIDKVSDASLAHVENEIEVRAANIVRAAESLSKLISDLKENIILNDFSTINDVSLQRVTELQRLRTLKEEELRSLYDS